MILFIEGKIDVVVFKRFCTLNQLIPQQTVFIFPGNHTHHQQKYDLFSIKSGGGLAYVAMLLGSSGYPTLSLPTTSMEKWPHTEASTTIVNNAIADLWYAIGANFSLVLPTRKHLNCQYFSNPIVNTGLEPSFWGGIQVQSNLKLGDFYIQNLNSIVEFLSMDKQNKIRFLQVFKQNTPLLYNSYIDGKQKYSDS